MTGASAPGSDTQPENSDNNEPPQPMSKRAKTFIVGAVLVGLSGGITAAVEGAFQSVVDGVVGVFKPEEAPSAKPTNGTGGPTPKSVPPPFTVQVEEVHPWDACPGGGGGMVYLKPPPISAINAEWKRRFTPPYDVLDEKSDFDAKYSGQPATYTILNVTVQGKTDTSVVIKNVKVRAEKVSPAPKALRLALSGACGDSSASHFSIDLDSPQQRKEFKAGVNEVGVERVRKFPFEVTKGEPETMEIVPFTNASDYRFKLVISWSSGAEKGDLVVGDLNHKGWSFRVVSGYQSEKYLVDQDAIARPISEAKVTDPFGEMEERRQGS
ncbi:hypothetical protein [Streptomyces canus]|uniref:hypothetical protein n=1 Tax=Streptomyces canus TaxID=58343 RepID=UPI002E307C17|nr:hypothetical protein [Streptomyces canus]